MIPEAFCLGLIMKGLAESRDMCLPASASVVSSVLEQLESPRGVAAALVQQLRAARSTHRPIDLSTNWSHFSIDRSRLVLKYTSLPRHPPSLLMARWSS